MNAGGADVDYVDVTTSLAVAISDRSSGVPSSR